jgi:DNA-binding CsgD family transcriptional regulator/tetratricopeptide (TPR) repeat protein
MTTTADALERGREAFAGHGWRAAYTHLSAADRQGPLEPAEVERLAMAAFLIGRDAESIDLLARAHAAFLAQHEPTRAVRAAFWVGFALLTRGDHAQASGWMARARRLLDESGPRDCVEQGYLLLPEAIRQTAAGEIATAQATFAEAARIGDRFGDRDLVNLARQGDGRTLIALGEVARGVALLDETMVAVTAGELTPIIAGVVYCSVISACFEMFDLRRAREWTSALTHWCASQPDLVPYHGYCMVHRAEILQLQGVWPDAIDEARRACDRLAGQPGHAGVGPALYQLGELHRLRGEFDQAEEIYRQASQVGRSPYPGLALLRLAQGRVDAAKAAICRLLDETQQRRVRSMMLAAAVDILLASEDVPAARRAAEELAAIAVTLGTPYMRALSDGAIGAVLLAEGDARAALAALREAWTLWRELVAPYETACVTLLIGLACHALGDEDSAQMELEIACRAFRELGAAPDVARLERLAASLPYPGSLSATASSIASSTAVAAATTTTTAGTASAAAAGAALTAPKTAGGLTAREIEVLQLVASGRTNRAIADALTISEKTVARHVSNIFTKLDLSSRAAATAYAFQHGLV